MINVNGLPNKLFKIVFGIKVWAKHILYHKSVTVAIIVYVCCFAKGHHAEIIRWGYTIYQKEF